MNDLMGPQLLHLVENHPTLSAPKPLLSFMIGLPVKLQTALGWETDPAKGATGHALPVEHHLVFFQVRLRAEDLATVGALEAPFTLVHSEQVDVEAAACCETLPALLALKGLLTAVDHLVGLEIATLAEHLPTVAAAEGLFCLERVRIPDRFVTS